MTEISIDAGLCSGCKTCTKICPYFILMMDEPAPIARVDPERITSCCHCGHCEAVCPEGAITIQYAHTGTVPGYPDEKTLTPGEIGRHILMRRTVRDYTRKPVPKETLLQILEIVRYAPTGMNGQPVHWTVMRDPAQVHDLAGIIIEWATNIVENQQGHTLAPILPMIIEAWKAGIDLVCHDAPGLVIAHGDKDNQNVPVDSVIAMAHLDLVAPSYGLGTCWAGFVRIAADASPEVAEALHLPEGHKSSCAMLIGYPEFRFRRIPKRNALRVTWR